MARLSVVVPFYNVADYIADCLDSLERQTFTDLEVILVDDGSKDDSRAVAEEFCARDPRFCIVTQENQGLGPARNTGVKHADGEYVTFVDSDDLVPRYAYELMVGSLDETGSSFAAGNARRFSNSQGVRPSWVHRIPFGSDRINTHVMVTPELILDRMIWNKVYRRSFWDQYGYQFPAIRYEDYPVTLKAHLDAATVDCFSAPVYFWRERESGESITQLKWEYANLLDRVVSAEMVLDIVDKRAPMLRRRVHEHFAQVDLPALVQAFASIPDQHRDDLVALGQRLTGRLDWYVLARRSRFARIGFRALRAGDFDLLRRLAQFQIDGGVRGGVRARRHPIKLWRYEAQFPGLTDRRRSAPRRLYQLSRKAMRLATSVTYAGWTPTELVIRGTAEVKHLPTAERSALRLTMLHGHRRIPVTVDRFEARDQHGEERLVGFEARVPRATLADLRADGKSLHFEADFTTLGMQRKREVKGAIQGNPIYAPGAWVAEGVWYQPGTSRNGWYTLRQYRDPWELTSAEVVDETLRLHVRLPGEHPEAEVVLTRSSGNEVRIPLLPVAPPDGQLGDGPLGDGPLGDGPPAATNEDRDQQPREYTATIPTSDLTDGVNPDDPFTMSTVWAVRVHSGDNKRHLMLTGLTQMVAQSHHGRLVTLTRSPGNYAQILEGPLRPVADELLVDVSGDGQRLVVRGDVNAATLPSMGWRHYLAGDLHIDVPCEVQAADGRFEAVVDISALTSAETAERPSLDPRVPKAFWSLWAIPARGSAYAVHIDAYLSARLPIQIETATEGGRVTVEPLASTFHLGVW